MPPDPPGPRPSAPVVLRIKLRYDDLDAMVSRFAPNVGKSGLFLPTKSLQPVGSEVKFELRLANDTPALLGLGRVKLTKAPDPGNPKASFGMAIELMRVTRESRDLILRMLERRKQLGLPEVAIPMPADLDAARTGGLVDTAVREVKDPVSAPIPAAVMHVDSQPSVLTAPRRPSGPVAIAKVTTIDPLPPEPARRKRPVLSELIERASGPIAAVTVPGLDEEVDVAAVIARARILSGGDLDSELEALREAQATPNEISIEAASAELARQLGGAAVRRDSRGHATPTGWAPPPAVADAAQKLEVPQVHLEPTLDLRAVAPAPPSDEVPEASTMVAPEPADTVADPATAAAALGDNAELRAHVVFDSVTAVSMTPALRRPAPELEPEPEPAPEQLADSDEQLADSDEQLADSEEPPEEHEVEPDQIHDEIHQLGEADYEEVEHTQIGAMPTPSFDEHVFATTPSMQAELAQKLDAHLAEVEAEGEQDDLGIGEASGSYLRSKVGLPPAQIFDDEGQPPDLDAEINAPAEPIEPAQAKTLPPEYQQDFIHRFGAEREAYRDDAYAAPDLDAAEPAYDEQPAEQQAYDPSQTIDAYGQTMDASLLAAEPAPSHDAFAPGYEGLPEDQGLSDDQGLPEDELEEIDDFEILAEADEEDADLLSSSGEADASGSKHTLLPEGNSDYLPPASDSDFLPPARESDFAMRLDLPDDDEPPPDAYVPQARDAVPQHQALAASAGHALAGFEEEEEGSHSFTYAEPPQPQGVDFDEPHSGFVAPNRFDQSDVIALSDDRRRQRPASRVPAPDPGESNDALATPPYHEPYVLHGPAPQVSWDENSQRNRWQDAPLPAPQPSEEIDLESALEALDVDLDDLSTPHGPTEVPRSQSSRRNAIRPPSSAQMPEAEPRRKSTRIPRGRAPRASTEDGVLIDFDDDEEK